MPLRARVDGQDVLSIDLSRGDFDALRGRRDLTMSCCDRRAIPKRSVSGLPFFAHDRRGECDYASETEFHLQGKVMIRDAALAAGWQAEVEVPGVTPQGQRWRADVLCVDRTRRVAFEMQHSGITLAHLSERQQRYRDSGVRGLWFMRMHERRLSESQVWQRETPALFINDQHRIPALDLSLSEVVQRALRGHLTLFPVPDLPIRLACVAHAHQCRWCRTIFGVVARVLLAPQGRPDFFVEANWTVEGLKDWVADILLQAGELRFPLVQRNAHRPHLGAVYDCPQCGERVYASSRPKDSVESWRRTSSQEALSERHFAVGRDSYFIMNTITTLSAAQHQWFTVSVGERWLLRHWLRGAT